jgi:tetratricopeptide (TPR) repeat protein
MAYVRIKGNQLAIVHGVRDPETKKSVQQTLFLLYSKAEALAAIGKSDSWFRNILEEDNPTIKFNWEKINKDIRNLMDTLPDLFHYGHRKEKKFRESLLGFTKELLHTNPQSLYTSAQLITDHRYELELLNEFIEFRLKFSNQTESDFNKDNPFHWRSSSFLQMADLDILERLNNHFQYNEFEETRILAKMIVEMWPKDPTGYRFLGHVAVEHEEYKKGVEYYAKSMKIARNLFPKRISKKRYWSDDMTRPYIRVLTNSIDARNLMGDYETALKECDVLENDCDQDLYAASCRVPIYLNSGKWELAAKYAWYVHDLYPEGNLLYALAKWELGEKSEALVYLIRGALLLPRTVRILCGINFRTDPETGEEIRGHNQGVSLLRECKVYLGNKKNKGRRFFKMIIRDMKMIQLQSEMRMANSKWDQQRVSGADSREWFEKIEEMKLLEYAKSKAQELFPSYF